MKKLWYVLIFSVLSAGAALAGPVGNIADPAILKKSIIREDTGGLFIVGGAVVDVVTDRVLETNMAVANQLSDSLAEDYEITYYGLKIGTGFLDKGIAYLLLGSGTAGQGNWDTKSDFIWGAGVNYILYEKKFNPTDAFRVGVDAKFRYADWDGENEIRTYAEDAVMGDQLVSLAVDERWSSSWEFTEWQVALAASYQLYAFCPYAGIKYSDVSGERDFTGNVTKTYQDEVVASEQKGYTIDNDAEDNFGYFLGAGFNITDMATINVEGRFGDEEALSGSFLIRF